MLAADEAAGLRGELREWPVEVLREAVHSLMSELERRGEFVFKVESRLLTKDEIEREQALAQTGLRFHTLSEAKAFVASLGEVEAGRLVEACAERCQPGTLERRLRRILGGGRT